MQRLAKLLEPLAHSDGYNATRIPGVGIFKASQSRSREPLCYSQGIIFVAQGSKQVFLEQQVYDYNPDNYLVLTLPIPAECATHVKAGEPLLGLVVDIDMGMLHQLVREFDEHQQTPVEVERLSENKSLFVSHAPEALRCALLRLVQSLSSPLQADVLGKALLREVLFWVLSGPNAVPLFALALHNTHLSRLEKALKHIHENYYQALDVNQLAGMANMSPSSFHRNFRQVTSSSPIQYLKKLRLSKARELLLDQGLKVKQAAAQVGYESPNQFSREFKRYFGESPQDCSLQLAS
ncbi:AraC family transcriptional regulator [Aliagarivorans taiwanensis]|uniref:AraC family transcriptional regulator n=1 Tax=Aliagarivorans taiwanensis TaxID=561966 RepID=UPI00047DA2FB|nr:AraC family transcriptional regulator [Aliagarivorans taiwanensis]